MEIKQGGKRKGAGRKPIEDKKIRVSIWVAPSKIEALGGMDNIKNLLKKYISTL